MGRSVERPAETGKGLASLLPPDRRATKEKSMAEIRVERKKKGIPLIYILLALIALAVIAWMLLDDDDEAVETAPAVSVLDSRELKEILPRAA
jgi:hypothetical protein